MACRHGELEDVKKMQDLYKKREDNKKDRNVSRAFDTYLKRVAASLRYIAEYSSYLHGEDENTAIKLSFAKYLNLLGQDPKTLKLALDEAQTSIGLDYLAQKNMVDHIGVRFPILSQSEEWKKMKSDGKKMRDGWSDVFDSAILCMMSEKAEESKVEKEKVITMLLTEADPRKHEILSVLLDKEAQKVETEVQKNDEVQKAYNRLAEKVPGGPFEPADVPRARRSTRQFQNAMRTITIGWFIFSVRYHVRMLLDENMKLDCHEFECVLGKDGCNDALKAVELLATTHNTRDYARERWFTGQENGGEAFFAAPAEDSDSEFRF